MQVLHRLQKYLCFSGEKFDLDGFYILPKCYNWIESVGDIAVVIYQKYIMGRRRNPITLHMM